MACQVLERERAERLRAFREVQELKVSEWSGAGWRGGGWACPWCSHPGSESLSKMHRLTDFIRSCYGLALEVPRGRAEQKGGQSLAAEGAWRGLCGEWLGCFGSHRA